MEVSIGAALELIRARHGREVRGVLAPWCSLWTNGGPEPADVILCTPPGVDRLHQVRRRVFRRHCPKIYAIDPPDARGVMGGEYGYVWRSPFLQYPAREHDVAWMVTRVPLRCRIPATFACHPS